VKFGLTQATIDKIRGVFARHAEVERVILYGSRAKGNYRNGSDIDLTLAGGAELTLNILYKISSELDDLFLPYTIDLSILKDISDPDMLEHIERVGVTFYDKGKPAETA
jgi:predicted nucleotidyltransferase